MEVRSQKAMNCGRCGSSQRLEAVEYCGSCLCRVVEHRVKKALSKNLAGFRDSKGKLAVVIACPDPGSLQCITAAYLVRRLFGAAADIRSTSESGLPKALKNKNKAFITPMCADDLATAFVRLLIDNGGKAAKIETAHTINVLESVTEKELAYYAEMKKIKYREKEKGALKLQLQNLQARYPGTVEALARSGRHLLGSGRVKNG
ncbi:hypothetical protein HYV83_04780 [Candidatus Woesearchaeota archaeon]|nr:hypothetical protein [Candidatus Woesearchaeota archaeon]